MIRDVHDGGLLGGYGSQDWWRPMVDRVAETHFVIRPMINRGLEGHIITPEGQRLLGVGRGRSELWQQGFGDRFFDMGTLVRLAQRSRRDCAITNA